MGNMSLSGSSGGSQPTSTGNTKDGGAARRLILLRDIAKTHTDAGQEVPKGVADSIKQANRELDN